MLSWREIQNLRAVCPSVFELVDCYGGERLSEVMTTVAFCSPRAPPSNIIQTKCKNSIK